MPTQDQYTQDFRDFFQHVHNLGGRTIYYCFSHIRSADRLREFLRLQRRPIPQIPSHLLFSLVHRCVNNNDNLSNLIRYIDNNGSIPEYQEIYLKLYSYLQVIETRYIYKVVGNGLRALNGDTLDGSLFDNVHSGYSCFKRVLDFYESLRRSGMTFSLFDDWAQIINKDLRNAIAHNDFIILSDPRILVVPYYIIKSTVNPTPNPPRDTYGFDDIDFLYQEARKFSEGFRQAAGRYVNFDPRY